MCPSNASKNAGIGEVVAISNPDETELPPWDGVDAPSGDAGTLKQWDASHVIHPATNLREQEQKGPIVIERGEGSTLWDTDGVEYLDGVAGLWLMNVGYGRDELVKAARRQMEKLAYYPVFFGYSNEPAIRLARLLASLAPGSLNHVLFCSGGSEAVEGAIKMARTYFHLKGPSGKGIVIARRRAYHGATHAAGSATGIKHIRGPKASLDPNIHHLDAPGDVHSPEALEEMIRDRGPERVAAFIAEPVVGVGGIHVPPEDYYRRVREICDRHDVLLIADEVITGFGRIGHMFGMQRWGVEPDLAVVAKGISSGYQPLGATLASDEVYGVLRGHDGKWSHGHTYAGHPVSCAVGLANIRIVQREDLASRAVKRGEQFRRRIAEEDHARIDHTRGVGLMNALELTEDIAPPVFERCLEEGLILRALGDSTLGTSPPLVITESEVERMVRTITDVLDEF